MVKCSFSGKDIPKGTGKMYIQKDGRVFHFLNSKCEKNMLKHNRKPLKTKWTNIFHSQKKENR